VSIDGAQIYSQGVLVAGLEIMAAAGGNLVIKKGDGSPPANGVNIRIHYAARFA
jgi:hypothetical protein